VIDHSETKVVIHGYACERSTRCDARLKLWVPETASASASLRWHVTTSPEFYAAGWVFKRGRTSSLTYCPLHAQRALRCTCERFGSKLFDTPTCPQHSATSSVRAGRAAIDARPESFAKLLNLTIMATER
jgi:hypothetical protein